MKSTGLPNSMFFPIGLWLGVASKTREMLLASSQVIVTRSARLATAGPLPSQADQREFALMSSEKVDAFSQSAAALGSAWTPALQTLGAQTVQGWMAIMNNALSLAGSRTPAQAMRRHKALVSTVMRRTPTLQRASDAAARVTDRALAPVHRTATANARRLGVPKKTRR
ncbi:polyhydroxyalkanoate granule-associated phasin [Methylibium sp.]|uniref:polyhydroxyalkanoate granule-associated phasin n=1 Tax=Methylibium sp. TaxID=2067992 RepID=UPI003D0E52D8